MDTEQNPIDEVIEKIAKECEQANAGKWNIAKIIKELNSLEIKEPEKMRAKALEMLKTLDPKAADVFASFQRMSVRTSKQEIEPFDRGNIIKSLLKETEVTRGVAEKIGKEVEEKINDLQISYINTALIREMVNVKLLEYGHEAVRSQYTRAGIPVFEVQEKISKQAFSNKEIMTEYTLLRVIPKELSDLHMSSDIFIANLADFATKAAGSSIQLERHKTVKKTVFENAKKISSMQKFFSWQINPVETNIALASLVQRKEAGETAELLVNALELCAQKKAAADIGINLFIPENLGYEVDNETMIVMGNRILEKTRQANSGLMPVFSIDTKYKLNLINKKECKKIDFLNCKKKYSLQCNGIPVEKGVLCMIGINLLKQASQKNPEEFEKRTIALAEKIKALGELKRKELEKRAYLKNAGIEIEKLAPVLGLYGLSGACRISSEKESQKKAIELCHRLLPKIKETLGKEWVFSEMENPLGIERFESQNKKMKIESKTDDKKQLIRAGMQKEFFFKAEAKNKPAFNKLMDENFEWIKFKP